VWERHQVQGATAESQYVFAEGAFRHILACAPHVTLIRPEEESAEPLAPSPFWAQAVAEETHREVDPWNAPDSVWARATWLKQAKKGLAHPVVFPPDDPSVEGHLLPENISVSSLATAFACPFRFYAETILKIFPPDELIMGISPMERGNLLHKALAFFTRGYRDQDPAKKKDRTAMETLLVACSDKALSSDTGKAQQTVEDNLGRHSRAMERRRWLGDKDGAPGLLTQWLDLELQRLDEGWCWLCEESSFEGLTVPGLPFSIGGRIDRIDGHKDKGIILWDYKSGEPPSARAVLEYLVDPQIPAYVLAAKEHRIAGVGKELGPDTRVSGGYILLKKTSSVSHRVLKPKEESWDQVLQEWKEAVASLGQKLVSGEFGAEPYPVSGGARQENACLYCPYRPLCNRKVFMY
jgi:RecB family exonuclease